MSRGFWEIFIIENGGGRSGYSLKIEILDYEFLVLLKKV